MRIGINALYLLPGRVGGSEIYIRNLVKWLAKTDPENTYVVFINRESKGVFETDGQSIEIIECPIRATNRMLRILWEQLVLPIQIFTRNIDVLFSAGMTSPFVSHVSSVVCIHDLQHVNQPKNFPPLYLIFLRSIIYLSSKTADGIVAISQKVKDDLMKCYRIPDEEIAVIYNGVDHSAFFPLEESRYEAVRNKHALPAKYILYAASSLPHKNHARLLEAFRIVKGRKDGIKLVLIGARDKGYDTVAENIREMGLYNDVVFTGWLPFEDVPAIFCASELFVFPSLHEGFGMPVIEAMSCGVPVVCSSIEPLREIAGDAAIFVDPYRPEDIARGILAILDDESLKNDLVRKGLRKAAEFTWEMTAQKTRSFLLSFKKK